MKKNFISVLLILFVIMFNLANMMYAETEEKIKIGQNDGIDAEDASTYPDDFSIYIVDSYGISASPSYVEDVVYENKPAKPEIDIYDEGSGRLLQKNTDYRIKYISNSVPGTAYMIIEGMGIYEGEVVYPFNITDDSGGYDLNDTDDEPVIRKKKSSFKPFETIIQTTLPMTPKPSYPPAVTIKPRPTASSTPEPTPSSTPKPTRMPKREPYVNIFDHNRFMWEFTAGEFGVDMYVSKAETAAVLSGIFMDKYDPGTEYTVVYEDVSEMSPFRNYIGFISQYGIMDGEDPDKFEPNKMMTRADFAVILSNFTNEEGRSSFIDVPRDYWAKEYIDKAAAEGWMTGTGDGRFMPDKYITRGELAKILVTFLGRDTEAVLKIQNLPQFSDVPPDSWAYPYVMAASTYM